MILVFLFLFSLDATPPHCPEAKRTLEWKQYREKIDTHFTEAANRVAIAEEADKVLTQLMRSKNLELTRWLQERGLNASEPTSFAAQWRKYYLETYILGDYPTPNPKVNKAVEILFKDMSEKHLSAKEKTTWEKLFKQAKEESLKTLKQWDLTEDLNKDLDKHISQLDLQWFTGLKGSFYQNQPREFLEKATAYSPTSKKIIMGMTSPLFPDEASRFSALVQAIALSVGPCYWPKSFEQDNPFLKLEDCLRDRQAAHAKKRDDRYLQSWVSRKKLSKETAEKLRQSPYCNHPIYPPPGVQKDELDEVFSHWFTAEVLAQTIAFKDTVLRADLCELSHRARRLEPGLSPQDTLQRIYYAQPQIKDRLNLTPKYKYCPLEL